MRALHPLQPLHAGQYRSSWRLRNNMLGLDRSPQGLAGHLTGFGRGLPRALQRPQAAYWLTALQLHTPKRPQDTS